jgi:hypothetical protein
VENFLNPERINLREIKINPGQRKEAAVCEHGVCADGYALCAIVVTSHGQKVVRLQATTLIAGEVEIQSKSDEYVLVCIESRRIAGP